ncbi:glucose 1-dehydrogenase [Bacillus sp. FJAT-29814]|uniref:glucose 1-dehydrogenase n=1 Tax=Bacillus sp. FJAT-29814 TaxID=1729688 RepID=UPI00082E0176|nr:glucose 1-dehydrogenase [Bacillus sp. FJAT-29814]
MNFSGKVVIVTGAGKGIGRGVAMAYAEKGGKVVVADFDVEAGERTVNEIREHGGEAIFAKTDVRLEEDVIRLMEVTANTYGKMDIIINNAGISKFTPFYELTLETWDNVINTNLRSVFLCSKEGAKLMRNNPDGGSIVNIASTRALMSEPNTEAYAATKGGIVALTHALAATLGQDRITVNAISPGWIHTGDESELREIDHEQHFSKRVGNPGDIARACLYLTAKENDFVTGINLVVDGGMTRKMIYEED